MKKGTKTLAALLIGATFALGLGACQPKQPVDPTPTPVKQTYVVTIANKTALQAEWPANGGGRKVEINVEPKANVAQLVKDGDVVITSSNTAVLNIAGLMAMPVAAGQATITVTSGENSDTVEVEISEALTIKTKYGVAHEGTEDDPLTNEEAITVANHADYNTDGGHEDLYVRGIVSSFYHAPGSRTDGAVSWFLTPAAGQTAKFEIYKCYKQGTGEASYLTNQDVWVGADVLAHGRFTLYNGQAETDGATYVRAWGTPPPERTTIEETFANTLAAGKALEDGADTYDYYKFDAYVTKKSGNDYFLTATKNEAITDAKANTIEIYFGNTAPAEAIANKLTKGAKITVKMVIKNYHGQIENLLPLTADDITVVEAGGTWDVTPEPAVETRTLAEFIAGENTKAKAYNVTAEVKSWKNATAAKDKYGNMVLTDGTNDLIIYGATATASALAWNDADAYAFTNPQDFLTNPTTAALNVGDTVTMKLIRADYNTTIEGSGISTNIVPAGGGGGENVPEPAVTTRTLAEFIAGENTAAVAYNVTAELKSFKNGGTAADKYGNLVLTDGTNDLIVYGSTATASALAWNNQNAYVFTNPQDFLTNPTTAAIKIGDTLTLKMIRADYNTTIEGSGIITNIVPGEGGEGGGGGGGEDVPADALSKTVNLQVGQWTVTGADSSSEQATLTSSPFSFQYNIGTATTYISSYGSNTTYAIRFYAGSSASISWDSSVARVYSITFTTNSKHFAPGTAMTGGAIDSAYTSAGASCKVNINEDATSLSWNNAAQVRLEQVVIVYTAA